MKTIIVTGAAGFLGNQFIQTLDKRKYDIYGIDIKKFYLHGVKCLNFNISNINKYVEQIPNTIHYLFHFAAIKDVKTCEENYDKTYAYNSFITLKLIMMLQNRIENVIYASSCSVYGNNKIPTKENFCPEPVNFYAVSKLSAENYLLTFSRIYNKKVIVLRIFNMYGKPHYHQKTDSYQGVIIKFINQIKNRLPVTIYGDGLQSRDFISVNDVCKILNNFIKKLPSDAVINVGTGKETRIIDLYHLLQKIIGKKVKLLFLKPNMFEIYRSVADNQRLLKYSKDFLLFTNIVDGLKHLV